MPEDSDLRARVDALEWYHTFDLAPGITTPGIFDHRPILEDLLIPSRLDGLRCLDAAASDGYFGFELKRRGAAEVVSLDGEDTTARDWQGPPGYKGPVDMSQLRQRFDLVREVSGLDVKRVQMNLYDISPEELGSFDLVFLGNVLLHLRNPQAALHALWSVTRGELISFEAISLIDTRLHPRAATARLWDGARTSRWWTHNVAGHRHLVEVSGFDIIETKSVVYDPFGPGSPRWPKRMPRDRKQLMYWLWTRQRGVPSSVVRARPKRGPDEPS